MRFDRNAAPALRAFVQDGQRNRKVVIDKINADGKATRGAIDAAHQEHMKKFEKASEANAHTHKQNEETHGGINGLKEEMERMRIDAEKTKQEIMTALTSSRKQPNPEPTNQHDLPSRALTFGADGEVVAVPIVDDASTLTSEDAEDADSKVASLKQELAEKELELKDKGERIQALTTPSGQVGLSEIPPSVTNLTGRARQAETKHVGEKTKRRQQDEQAKAMRTKRYVPAPTRRSTRSTRSSLAEK